MGKFSRKQSHIDQDRRGTIVIFLVALVFVVGLFHASARKRYLREHGLMSDGGDISEKFNPKPL